MIASACPGVSALVVLLATLAPTSALCQRTAAPSRASAIRPTTTTATIRDTAARARGVVSVTALDLRTGQTLALNPIAPVFMSSVVKLPLAVQLLARVDRGELRLSDSITLAAKDLRAGNGGLAIEYPRGGVRLSVDQLLERAI